MYAISTPIDDQYAGDGIAVRGVSYGMPSIRVDGNDLLAVYFATKRAREIIIKEKRPVCIEAISYRVGDHSTSDFSQRYRDEKEMKKWKELIEKFGSPIERMEKYLTKRGLLTAERNKKLRDDARNAVGDALKNACGELLPDVDNLFEDVYEKMPPHILEQREELRSHLRKYPNDYELEKFKNGKDFLKWFVLKCLFWSIYYLLQNINQSQSLMQPLADKYSKKESFLISDESDSLKQIKIYKETDIL